MQPLRAARDGDAGCGVEAEDVEDVLCLRAAEEFLEAGGVFEPLLQGFRALGGVGQIRLARPERRRRAFEPRALLLRIEELAQTFGAAAVRRLHAALHSRRSRVDAVSAAFESARMLAVTKRLAQLRN